MEHQEGMTHNCCFKTPERSVAARLRCSVWLLLAALVFPVQLLAQGSDTKPRIPVVGSGNVALDQHLVGLLSSHLEGEVELDLRPVDDNGLSDTSRPVIVIGPSAFARVRQQDRDMPILALMVKKDFIQSYTSRTPGQIGAIYYDVPLLRQALTGKVILPQAGKIALLATTETAELYESLVDQLSAFDLQARIFITDTEDRLIPALNRALSYGDFLLAGPDDSIYNPRTIKHILLTAYRRNRILIGPTQSYVKAGAIASSYAPFSDMTEQAADHLLAFLQTGQFPPADYPNQYRVEVNEQVARSLNIPLPDRQWIAEKVERMLQSGEASE